MQTITPCLWFNTQAEEAAKFYVSIFKNSKLGTVTRYGDAGAKGSGMPKGSVMVKCDSQAEIDEMWSKLSEGGEEGPCGWLKDKYGLSWQIVSPEWENMLSEKDPQRSERVMKAILQMTKPDLETITRAYAGR